MWTIEADAKHSTEWHTAYVLKFEGLVRGILYGERNAERICFELNAHNMPGLLSQ